MLEVAAVLRRAGGWRTTVRFLGFALSMLAVPRMATSTEGVGTTAGEQRLAAGLAAWQAGDAASATDELSRAVLLLDPRSQADAVLTAYFHLGLAHLDLAQMAEAAAALGHAAELSADRERPLAELRRWQALVARLAGDAAGAAALRAAALAEGSPPSSASPGRLPLQAPAASVEPTPPAIAGATPSGQPASTPASASDTPPTAEVASAGATATGSAGEADAEPAVEPASETPAFDHFFRRRPAPPAEPTPPPPDSP